MSVRANIERLSWDSDFFAFPIARLSDINNANSPLLISDTLADYKLVQAKINASDYVTLNALQNRQFEVVDGEIDFEIAIDARSGSIDSCLLLATEYDIPQIKNLAADAFTLSRFRAPWFKPQDNQRFYSTWAEKSVRGGYDDYCLMLKDSNDNIRGFVTLRLLDEQEVRVGLLVVNPANRKQGVGEALVKEAIAWCRTRHKRCLRIATQTGNRAALRLYIKCGATIAQSSYWLYRLT